MSAKKISIFKPRNPSKRPLRTLKTLQHIAKTIQNPPPIQGVYSAYNQLREHYILQATQKHFGVRADNPAPLFGKKLLDVGCGTATVAQFLALSGAEITAIDPNAAALAQARQAAEEYGAPITFVRAHAADLLAHPHRYDIILVLDVFETLAGIGKLMWVLRQLLAPGGVVVVGHITRTPRAWLYHVGLSSMVYGRTPRGSRHWRHFHTPAQLGEIAQAAGLKLKGVQGVRYSVTGGRWKLTSQRTATRYLAQLEAIS
jgi:2-polyprenyl-6-hydroxyphenyl methylase/3-demethylubiquinone-9 3-methyltransferase